MIGAKLKVALLYERVERRSIASAEKEDEPAHSQGPSQEDKERSGKK